MTVLRPDTFGAFGWKDQLARGKAGEERVRRWLREHGHTVVDVRSDPGYQALDVDFVVGPHPIEVKTDYHATDKLFLEFQAIAKSQATFWFFYTPRTDKLYCFRHAVLRDALMLAWYRGDKVHTITTMNGWSHWTVQGIVVPLARLKGKEWQL